MGRSGWRTTFGAVAGAVAVVAALSQLPHGPGASTRYASAFEMARTLGCEASYVPVSDDAAGTSAAWCAVAGARVDLRVFPTSQAGRAWDSAHRTAGSSGRESFVMGNAWALRVTDRRVSDQVIAAIGS